MDTIYIYVRMCVCVYSFEWGFMERDVPANIPSRSGRCRFAFCAIVRIGLGWAVAFWRDDWWKFEGYSKMFIENGEAVTWRLFGYLFGRIPLLDTRKSKDISRLTNSNILSNFVSIIGYIIYYVMDVSRLIVNRLGDDSTCKNVSKTINTIFFVEAFVSEKIEFELPISSIQLITR